MTSETESEIAILLEVVPITLMCIVINTIPEQVKLPYVLLHNCSHPPLLVKHSFTSI